MKSQSTNMWNILVECSCGSISNTHLEVNNNNNNNNNNLFPSQ